MSHPRDRFLTVYGRKPVLEALEQADVQVEKVLLAHNARGGLVPDIERAAKRAGVPLTRVPPDQVTRLSRNQRQDQGAVADVRAPRMAALQEALDALPPRAPAAALLLDGVTTPGNVGLLLRAGAAAGLDGIVVPRAGSPEVGPLVIKASAGVAFKAPIWRAANAAEAAAALVAAGFTLCGLAADGEADLFEAPLPHRVAFVLGNETAGVGAAVAPHVARWVRIPMAPGIESLNVAVAGAVVAFDVARRRGIRPAG
jgi:23S rRNA (guanosine2251-2'-O)-methyltransferase